MRAHGYFTGPSASDAGMAVCALLFGVNLASGNPALAENLRKSPVATMAAGATTVADQLAIRRFGVQPPAPTGFVSNGYVIPRGYYGHSGHHGGSFGYQYPGVDMNDDRLPDNFDLDQYDDEKPFEHRDDIGRRGYGHSGAGGIGSRRFLGNGFSYSNNGFGNVYWTHDPYYGVNGGYWWQQFPYGVDGRVAGGVQPGSQLRMPAPNSAAGGQPAPVGEPETDLQAARRLLRSSSFGASVELYRSHLAENPEAFEVMAELVVALAGDGRLDDAAALARLAYDKDPTLATKRISDRASPGSRDLRKTVVRAVRFAHDRESASAWLLVTLLMQAEDRDPVGLEMLQRAVDRGLPSGISDPLRAALR